MSGFKKLRVVLIAQAIAITSVAIACGGGSSPNNPVSDAGADAGNPDAGPASVDAGVDSGPTPLDPNYPTAHTPLPTVDYNGGRIIENVKVVTITFPNDALVDDLEQFGDTITQTPWWDTVRNGYCDDDKHCVGQGTSGGHVRLGDAPATSYTDSSQGGASTLQAMIAGYVADGTFPPPDANTLYAIYFPTATSITLDGEGSCSSFGGYHNTMILTVPPLDGGVEGGAEEAGAPSGPVTTAYAVLPRCDNSEAELTLAASHEFIEAATDPDIGLSSVAYYMNDELWAGELGGEVADLCVTYNNDDAYAQGSFTVQRVWSNVAATASHDPCQPAPAPSTQAYFNVAPAAGKDQLTMKVGATKTIQLTAFSDAAMPSDFDISADETDGFEGGSNVLTLSLSQATAHNGSKITLTITMNAQPLGGVAYYEITSTSGSLRHTWPLEVFSE